MTPGLAVQLALFAALALATGLLVRLVRRVGPLVPATPALRTVVHGVALGGPWLLYFQGVLPAPWGVGPLVPLALCWALYVLALLLVGLGTDRCERTSPAGQ